MDTTGQPDAHDNPAHDSPLHDDPARASEARAHADHEGHGPELDPDARSGAPLTEPLAAADHIDVVLRHEDRVAGCIAFVLCDASDRPREHLLIAEVPAVIDAAPVARFLDHLLPAIADADGALLFARGRDGGPLLTDDDRRWHELVIQACQRHGVRLLGAHLATPAAVRTFPAALRLVG